MDIMQANAKKYVKFTVLGASLVLLTGCDLWKKKNVDEEAAPVESAPSIACTIAGDPLATQGEALVSMNGKPIVSSKSFDVHYQRLLNENPQYKKFLEHSTEAKKNTLNGLAAQAAVDKYLCEEGIDKSPEYLEELTARQQADKRMLNLKYFTDRLDVKVTEADLREAYEKNKDTSPQLLVSRGGVKAVGIAFDKEDEAKVFAQKIGRTSLVDQAKLANISDKVRDFKLVHSSSFGLDTAVRDALVAMTQFPSVKVVQGKDQKYWVVQATGSEDKQYRSFAEAKEWLQAMVQREKGMLAFEQKLEALKKEYNIVVNDAFFGASTPADQDALIRELEQMVNQEQGDQSAKVA